MPIVGGALGVAGNLALKPKTQQVEQAQRDFVNAVLRKESGAAIGASEFKNAQRQYFPQPGDSKEVIEQKAKNRRTAIQGLRVMSGPGARMMDEAMQPQGYGNRLDGTKKGLGFLGELKRPDGAVSTELSIGVNFDGKEREIPALVPTLTKQEVDYLLNGGKPTKEIVRKAVEHARGRISSGKSPFAENGEQASSSGFTYLGKE